MPASLTIEPANAEPFTVAIGNTASIGRTRENTVCLNFSPLVSRQHALIRCHNGYQYQIIDLGSRNGTYVNNQRVVLPVGLQDGAKIRIADNIITFCEHGQESTDEHLAMTVVSTLTEHAIESKPVALMVCDIRAFSTMSETTPAAALAELLGAWFRELNNLVARLGGQIDKFIGDAMLAYWAGSSSEAANCGTAFYAARQIAGLASSRKWPSGEPFKTAVALHFGKVTFSHLGPTPERDATIIGDAVNTVFRLEAAAKELSQAMVLSGDFVEQLPSKEMFTDFGERELKGKSQLVRVFGMTE